MEQSSFYDEKTVRHKFDRKCKLALKGEVVDYERHLAYLRKHEVLFSELSEREIENFSIINEYALEKAIFVQVVMMWWQKMLFGRSIESTDGKKTGCYSFVVFYGNE